MVNSQVVVMCAHPGCEVQDPSKLELYLKDGSKRPLTKSGGKKWGTNLYPGIVAGHIDPDPFIVVCKMHRTMYTSSRRWQPVAPKLGHSTGRPE